jgi:hypothetical protein
MLAEVPGLPESNKRQSRRWSWEAIIRTPYNIMFTKTPSNIGPYLIQGLTLPGHTASRLTIAGRRVEEGTWQMVEKPSPL